YLLPELWLAFSLLFIIGLDLLISKRWPRAIAFLSLSTLIITFVLLCLQWHTLEQPAGLLAGMLQLDDFAVFFKLIFCLAGIFTVLLSVSPGRSDAMQFPEARQGEYYGIMLGLVVGTMLMSLSANLLSVYLSIEFVSICS